MYLALPATFFLLAFVSALVLCFVALPIFLVRREQIAATVEGGLTGEAAWTESGLQTFETVGFRLLRAVPETAARAAAFSILEVDGRVCGELRFADQVRASLVLNGASYEKYSQSAGAFKTPFAGEAGATSDRSIVVRCADRLAAEIFPQRAGLGFDYTIAAGGKAYSVKSARPFALVDTSIHRVELDAQLVALYRRQPPKAAFVALAPGLDEDVAAALLVISQLT